MAESRIQLQPRSAWLHAEREIHLGWNESLHTYFAHVLDGHDEAGEEHRTLEIGQRLGEITYPGGVIDAVRPYTEIPDDLGTLLAAGRASDTATFTDLRPESAHFVRDAHIDAMISRRYQPDASQQRIDELLEHILGTHTATVDGSADLQAGGSVETTHDHEDDTLREDDGFQSGLGY